VSKGPLALEVTIKTREATEPAGEVKRNRASGTRRASNKKQKAAEKGGKLKSVGEKGKKSKKAPGVSSKFLACKSTNSASSQVSGTSSMHW
jgi:hypothetical protein